VLDLLFAVEAHKGLNFDQDMNQTVVQLGLQDKVPFLEIEEHAMLEQLMMSRSGIYIPTGNGDQEKILPKHSSAYPGTRFFHNNWDFDGDDILCADSRLSRAYRDLRAPRLCRSQ
jgi:hypothetical protein